MAQHLTLKHFQMADHVLEKLQDFNSSIDIEVQERANSACILIEMLRAQFNDTNVSCNHDIDFIGSESSEISQHQASIPPLAIEIIQEMALLFSGELIPVAPKAQRKVPLPDGLDLDEWINPPPEAESSSSSNDEKEELFVSYSTPRDGASGGKRPSEDLTPEQIERQRMQRLIEQSNNPHYLKSSPSTPDVASKVRSFNSNNSQNNAEYDNIDEIPIAELSLDVPLKIGGLKGNYYSNNFK